MLLVFMWVTFGLNALIITTLALTLLQAGRSFGR
jgi:hypothetical protein